MFLNVVFTLLSLRDQRPGSTATYNGKCYIFYDNQVSNIYSALLIIHITHYLLYLNLHLCISIISSPATSGRRSRSALSAAARWWTSPTPRCRGSSAGSCGGGTAGTLTASTGWGPRATPRTPRTGSGSMESR